MKQGRVGKGKDKKAKPGTPLAEPLQKEKQELRRFIVENLVELGDPDNIDPTENQEKIAKLGDKAIPILQQIREGIEDLPLRLDIDEILELIELKKLELMVENKPEDVTRRTLAAHSHYSENYTGEYRYYEILAKIGNRAITDLIEIASNEGPANEDVPLLVLQELATGGLRENHALLKALPLIEGRLKDKGRKLDSDEVEIPLNLFMVLMKQFPHEEEVQRIVAQIVQRTITDDSERNDALVRKLENGIFITVEEWTKS